MSAGTVTIGVIQAVATNWEGDAAADDPEPIQITGCKKYPIEGVEDSTRGDDVLSRMGVWTPPGSAAVTALDTVLLDGARWRVVGPPKVYESGRGKPKGTIIELAKRGTKT